MQGSDGGLVELIPGGSDIQVTYQRRNECGLFERFRVHEFDQQFAAICRGFGTIVPLRMMPLFTWQEAGFLCVALQKLILQCWSYNLSGFQWL